MLSTSPSCPKTSSWHDASGERERLIAASSPSQHPGPFQGQSIPPRGDTLEKLIFYAATFLLSLYYSAVLEATNKNITRKYTL